MQDEPQTALTVFISRGGKTDTPDAVNERETPSRSQENKRAGGIAPPAPVIICRSVSHLRQGYAHQIFASLPPWVSVCSEWVCTSVCTRPLSVRFPLGWQDNSAPLHHKAHQN